MGLFVGSKIRRALPVATFTHKFFLFIFCGAAALLIYIPLVLAPVVVPIVGPGLTFEPVDLDGWPVPTLTIDEKK